MTSVIQMRQPSRFFARRQFYGVTSRQVFRMTVRAHPSRTSQAKGRGDATRFGLRIAENGYAAK